jgi:hypothetical protein
VSSAAVIEPSSSFAISASYEVFSVSRAVFKVLYAAFYSANSAAALTSAAA